MTGFEPTQVCADCKGRCCKEKGCSLSPEDLIRYWQRHFPGEGNLGDDLKVNLLKILQEPEGYYAIDCHSDEKGILYYLRMRHKCYTFIGVDAIGECVALTPDGCALGMEDRPKGGRYLKPSDDRHCIQTYDAAQMRTDWEPYGKILAEIWTEYEEHFEKDGTFDACDEAYFAWMRAQRVSQQNN